VLPSLVRDQVGLCDHERLRGDDLPFASVLRPADSLSTLQPWGYPRWVQDSVLTGWLGVSKVAFSCHYIPPCLLGATPTDPYVRHERLRFLTQSSGCPSTVRQPSVVRGGELSVSSLSLASACSARRRLPSCGALGPHFPTCTSPLRRDDCHPAPLGSLRLSLASRSLAGFSGWWWPQGARGPVAAPRPRQGFGSPGPPLRAWAPGDRWRSHVPACPL
jgi:hypothetical protein